MRIGQGIDVHRLVAGRRLVIGGVEIEHDRGLEGHSDGDVLLHAVADAVLGALGEGDLGRHFPSSDESLAGIASSRLVEGVVERMQRAGRSLVNLDATVIAQAPRLAPFQPKMRANVAALLRVSEERVNIKLTSTDGLGVIGAGDGMAALVSVLLESTEATG